MASSLLDPAVDGTPVLDVELPDFTTEAYKSAYSRINAIVIEGEQEAHDNYISLGTLIPDQADELAQLARMEMKHMKGFMSCVMMAMFPASRSTSYSMLRGMIFAISSFSSR